MTDGALHVSTHQLWCSLAVAGFEGVEDCAVLVHVVVLPVLGSAPRACHGALFALADGAPLEGPATDPIRVFAARATADGRIVAEIPILPA